MDLRFGRQKCAPRMTMTQMAPGNAALAAGVTCKLKEFYADGFCDAANNVEACKWDGGDCCEVGILSARRFFVLLRVSRVLN